MLPYVEELKAADKKHKVFDDADRKWLKEVRRIRGVYIYKELMEFTTRAEQSIENRIWHTFRQAQGDVSVGEVIDQLDSKDEDLLRTRVGLNCSAGYDCKQILLSKMEAASVAEESAESAKNSSKEAKNDENAEATDAKDSAKGADNSSKEASNDGDAHKVKEIIHSLYQGHFFLPRLSRGAAGSATDVQNMSLKALHDIAAHANKERLKDFIDQAKQYLKTKDEQIEWEQEKFRYNWEMTLKSIDSAAGLITAIKPV